MEATAKQINFINNLLNSREVILEDSNDVETIQRIDSLSMDEASKLIGKLLACPEKKRASAIERDGMYITADGTIYKAQYNKAAGDGRRLYAKRLELGFDNKVTFVYEAGAASRLTSDMRMTLEQAKEFGALYGTCVRCGRTLTLEESIERAMGRVCANSFM